MWKSLLRLLFASAAYWGAVQAAHQRGVNTRTVKAWLVGAALVFGSALIGAVGVVILIMSLFFELAHYEQLVMPAAITGAVTLLLAVVVMIEAVRMLRPRQGP